MGSDETIIASLNAEAIILDLSETGERPAQYFIGGLAYGKTIRATKRHRHRVYPSTLKPERLPAIAALISHIAHKLGFEMMSTSTIHNTLRSAKGFIVWLEENTTPKQQTGFFESFSEAREVLEIYCNYLRHRCSQPSDLGIAQNAAYNLYRVSLFLIQGIHGRTETEITEGISTIKSTHSVHGTKAAPPHIVQSQISTIKLLAMSLADGLLSDAPLPHKIDLGPLGKTYATPGKNPILSESVKIGKSADLLKSPKWDYDKNCHKENLRKSLKSEAINANPNPQLAIYSRLFDIASKCFYVYFSAMLATNKSSLDKVQVNRDISIGYSKQRGKYGKLTTLKGRAGNQEQEFLFERVAHDALKKYVALRDWALNGNECPWLFISFSGADTPARAPEFQYKTFWSWYKKNLDPEAISLNSRQLRLNKANAVLDQTGDIFIGSTVLQNSATTFLRSYSKGSETKAAAEVSNGLKHIITTSVKDSSTPIYSIGNCASTNHKPSIETPPPEQIDVDCRTPEGCLFCEHFAIHPDKEDLWKLLSFKYVLHQTSSRGSSISEASEVFLPIYQRIDALVDAACRVDPSARVLVEEISTDVKRERLSPYWHTQLDKWINIGLIHD